MAKTFKVDTSRHIADGIVKAFMILHLSPKGYYLLTTIGRKSGKPRSTPVVLIEEGNRRWLVAPFGEVSWVYNIKANGKVTLARNGKSEKVRVQEVTVEQAAPILRKYVVNVPITQSYFNVGPDSPDEDYIVEAPKHPVFEIFPING